MTTASMPTTTAPTTTAPTDYAASDSEQLPGTPIARWDANIAAIRTLKELESEGRPATPAEQAVLAKYSGFGDSAFEQGFGHYSREPAWEERKATLKELVSGEEYEAIKQSRLNAFYTSPEVVKTMWQGLEHLGADKIPNPKVLEPSSGSGRFLALQPPGMAARSERTAVELDNLTAGMAKHLYPNASVWNMGFQDAPLPDDSFDVAISNVPFGNYGVHDSDFLRSGRKFLAASIHNYFFAKTLDKLRPGGVLAFVTTHHTLDSEKAQRVREYLAEQADLLGAVRLPENAFPDTQVVTDIIYLRKRLPGEAPGDTSWVETVEAGVTDSHGRAHAFPVNKYFAENPDMVLGKHSAGGTMYRLGSYTVERGPGSGPLPAALTEATRQITAVKAPDVLLANRPVAPARQPSSSLPAPKDSPKLGAKDAAKVQEMAGLRDSARRLLDMERGGGEGGEGIGAARAELREQYQRFVEQHQALNDKANYKLMAKDPDAPVLFALENFDKETKSWKPAAIFSRRVIGAPAERDVANVSDAMSVAFNESGSLDFDRMGQLLGQSPDAVRAELAGEQLIFHNPEGGWEPANEYLTGRVRDKLWTARQVAAKNPAYQGNVDALEAVQPEDVPAGDIAAPLGAPWIPDSVVNQWVREHWDTPRGNWFKYSEDIGQWSKAGEVPALDATLRSDWGTPEMGADDILLHTLKGSPVNITKPDGQGGRVKDLEGTLAAQGKASRMQESFSDWIWRDPERNARLARKYNDTHNALRPRVFDGSHQEFPGMAPEWQKQLREHQRDATFRVVHDGTALLAHEVGFGKTAVMVASAMERKRLGLVNKPVFVVPKATHKQLTAQFREIYPGAKLLSPDEKDFSSENREVFLSRIATGDWDGVVLTSEQFQKIPVSPETEVKWIRGQLDDLRSAQEGLARDSVRRKESRTQKQIQKSIESLNVKLKDLRAEMREATDKRALSFETLGIDQIYVDEADRYKNLPFATSMGQIKGLPNSESKRAWDMFLKAQYVQERGERKPGSFARNGVVFATGTPVANTIAEAWTMMRYLQLPELRRRGLHHFDPWAKTYGSITSGLEQTPQGQYKVTQRFAKFVNLPELSQLFQNVADVRVASEVPEMLAAQPRLVDEEGNPKRTTVVAPSHPALGEYMEHLRARVDKLGNVDPTVDNMLLISSDARKAALDLRMVDPSAPANPNGKVQLAAEKIAAVYRGEQANRGTQLVFLDIGTPKARDKAGDLDPEGGGSDLTANEQRYVSDVYAVLKRELERRGVPGSQVAFIQDYKTDKARKDLFEKVNSGDVRVLVGSTETAGVGVNVQKRAAALHHLDVPWRPRDIEQREGRIVRQGNEVYGPVYDDDGQITAPGRGVKIYQYVQEGSFDEFMWQAVQVKGQAVKALMKRNMSARSMEDIDPLVLGAAEAKALASGNPLIMRAEGLKNQVNTLRLERAAQRNQAGNAASRITLLTSVVDGYRERIPKMEEDARLAANLPDAFSVTVNGKVLDSRPKAGEAVQAGLKSLAVGAPPRGIGAYKAFQVSAVNTDRGYQLIVSNPATGVPYRSGFIDQDETSPAGLVSRLENLVKGIPNTLESTKEKLQESEASLAIYRSQVGKPFERAGELSQLEAELRATQAALSGDAEGVDAPAPSSDRQADASGIRADGQPVVAATTGEQAGETRRERQAQEAAVEQWGRPEPEALQSRPPDPVQHGPALSEWSAQEPEATEATEPGPAQADTPLEDARTVGDLRQPVARREEEDLAPLTETAPEPMQAHDDPVQPHGPALSEWSPQEPEATEAAVPGPPQPDTPLEDAQAVDELQTATPAYMTEAAPEPTQVHDGPVQHGPALSEWSAQEPEATEIPVPAPAQPDTLMEGAQALDELRQPVALQEDEGTASLTETVPEPTQIHERWERDQEVAPAATPALDTGFGLEPTAQSTLGNDFATNRSLEMPVASPPAKAVPLADIEALEALKDRREQLAAGQQDIFEEDTELANPNVPPKGSYDDAQGQPTETGEPEPANQGVWQEGSPEPTIDTPPERLAPDWDLSEDECLTLGESSSLCMVSPEELRFDAATFQYKANTDSSGISDKLQDVKEWDPDLAGISYVWERKDGTRFIVDGHQRLGLAQRLAAEGQNPQLLVKIWREEDGATAEDMRLRAAKKNIAEQSGTAVDAARVLKQKPGLLDSVSRQNAVARDARRLVELDDEVFEEAAGSINAGKLDATVAGLISQNTHNAALQRSLLRTLTQASASEDMTVGKAQELVYAYKEAQNRHQEGKAQSAMFDDAAVMESAWKERAALLSGLVKSFKDDKRLFGAVTRKEGKLEDAGNVLDEISNQHHLDDAQKGIFIFETLAHTRGPLADYLTRQAERIKQAADASGKPAGQVAGPIVGESAKFLRPFLREYHHGGADRLQVTLKGPEATTASDPEPVADTGESNGLPESPVPTSVPDEAPPPVTRRVRARPSGTTAGTTAVPAVAPVDSPARRVRTREKVPAPVASVSPGGSRRAAPKASPARQLSLDEQILQEAAIKLGGKKHSHHQGIKQPKMVKGNAAMLGSRSKKRSGRMPFTGGMGKKQ